MARTVPTGQAAICAQADRSVMRWPDASTHGPVSPGIPAGPTEPGLVGPGLAGPGLAGLRVAGPEPGLAGPRVAGPEPGPAGPLAPSQATRLSAAARPAPEGGAVRVERGPLERRRPPCISSERP